MIEWITGLAIGIITGIMPGLHPNTIIPLLAIISTTINPTSYAIMLVTLAISANYFEFIKTTYLSSPDEGTAISMSYTQQLIMQGRGLEAIKLLSTGALGATLTLAIITPLILNNIPAINNQTENYIGIILASICAHSILKEGKNMKGAIKIFTLSGILGILTLRTEIINQPLLPLLTGFYGTSNMIKNMKIEKTPKQMSKVITCINKKTAIKGIIKSAMASSIITFVPAIGPSQASFISNEAVKTKNKEEKLITLGGVNTGDVIYSITALFAINKSRSGIIDQITITGQENYLTLILTAAITAITCYYLVNKTANYTGNKLNKINYSQLNKGLLMMIGLIVLAINGWKGLIVLAASTLIGLKCKEEKTSPSHMMSAIITPAIIYYL